MNSNYFSISCAVVILLSSPCAFAYLDPGTGSLLLQLVLGGIAGLATITKLYWQQLKSLFTGNSVSTTNELDTDENITDEKT